VRGLPGVRGAYANTGSGVVTVEYDPQRTTTAALASGLRPTGFRAGGAQTRIGIEGLRCARAWLHRRRSAGHAGRARRVRQRRHQEATITYLPQQTTLAQLNGVIQDWGYQTRPAASEEPVDRQEAEHDREYAACSVSFSLPLSFLCLC